MATCARKLGPNKYRFNCENIDFMGSTKPNIRNDYQLVDNFAISRGFQSAESLCNKDWLDATDKYGNPLYPNTVRNLRCHEIPLLETCLDVNAELTSRQFVFGRVSNLRPYYQCEEYFVASMTSRWSVDLNDTLVWCATDKRNTCMYPIRFVTDITKDICAIEGETGIPHYATTFEPYIAKDPYANVTSREICQLVKYFGWRYFSRSTFLIYSS